MPGHGHNAVGKKVVLVEAISKCHLTNSYYVRVDILKLEKKYPNLPTADIVGTSLIHELIYFGMVIIE